MPRKKQDPAYIGPVYIRAESRQLLAPSELGGRVENFVYTRENTLRSVIGPLPYQVNDFVKGGGFPADYQPMHGVVHARLASGRDILLLQMASQLYVHKGAARGWEILVGPAGSQGPSSEPPQIVFTFPDSTRPQFPTQFVVTPYGIIILPQSGRPLFYDGIVIANLGFTEIPSAPTGIGPKNGIASVAGATLVDADESKEDGAEISHVNVLNYAHDSNPAYGWASQLSYWTVEAIEKNASKYVTGMLPIFGRCRVGTVAIDDVSADQSNTGRIEMSSYTAAVQWVDRWGNLSASSPRSASVLIYPQSGRENQLEGNKVDDNLIAYVQHNPDLLLKQLMWMNIPPGPEGTMGRVLSRTKDLLHSGTDKLFEVPSGAGALQEFATIPDNQVTVYPDNIPDEWLLAERLDTRTIPRARLAALAFGRCFYANSSDEPGTLWWSIPGRYGTIERLSFIIPDATSLEVTGLYATPAGLLVFTLTTTFLIKPGDDGQGGFVPLPLSTKLGCVAPSSIQSLPSGEIIWMAKDGFCSFKPFAAINAGLEPPARLGREVDYVYDDINRARWEQSCSVVDPQSGEYRCWAPGIGSIYNDLCFTYDEVAGFRSRRESVFPAAVCNTNDHRRYVIAVGRAAPGLNLTPPPDDDAAWKNGVWLMDHEEAGYDSEAPAVFETNWIGNETSFGRQSAVAAKVWLRASQGATLKVEVLRDWRDEVVETTTCPLHPTDIEDTPFWDEAKLDDAEKWLRRRPFWANVDFSVPGAEVFKLRLSVVETPVSWEIIGMMFNVNMKGAAAVRNVQ